MEDKLAHTEIVDVSKLSGDTIKFGATVTVIDEDTGERSGLAANGLPRQQLPKGTDFSVYGADEVAAVAAALNERPCKTLN